MNNKILRRTPCFGSNTLPFAVPYSHPLLSLTLDFSGSTYGWDLIEPKGVKQPPSTPKILVSDALRYGLNPRSLPWFPSISWRCDFEIAIRLSHGAYRMKVNHAPSLEQEHGGMRQGLIVSCLSVTVVYWVAFRSSHFPMHHRFYILCCIPWIPHYVSSSSSNVEYDDDVPVIRHDISVLSGNIRFNSNIGSALIDFDSTVIWIWEHFFPITTRQRSNENPVWNSVRGIVSFESKNSVSHIVIQ